MGCRRESRRRRRDAHWFPHRISVRSLAAGARRVEQQRNRGVGSDEQSDTKLIGTIVGVGLLAGCAPGLVGGDRQSDPNLHRVLVSDSDVPARQGLLFIAMQDAEVALQSAVYAVAADEPAEAKARINNMLHAIDPSFPGTPTVTSSGIAAFWPGTGFGLRRSVEGIAEQARAIGSRPGASEQVVAQAGQVVTCAEETLGRIDRVESLGQQALAAGSAAEMAPLLAEADRQTHIMMEAPAAGAAGACSLEDAKAYLDSLALELA